MRVFDIIGVAAGYESLTTANAIGFTSTKILPTTGSFLGKQARAVLISVETADVRFCLDGTTPTVTVGHLLALGQSYEITGEQNVANFRCMNAVAGSGATVKCTYFF
jgi:hypothetical protein